MICHVSEILISKMIKKHYLSISENSSDKIREKDDVMVYAVDSLPLVHWMRQKKQTNCLSIFTHLSISFSTEFFFYRGQRQMYTEFLTNTSFSKYLQWLVAMTGAWDTVQVSHQSSRNPATWVITSCLPEAPLAGNWSQELEPESKPRISHVRCKCHCHHLNY